MSLEIIVGMLLAGINAYLVYLIKRKDAETDKKFESLQQKDEAHQKSIEFIRETISKQSEAMALGEQRDKLDLRLTHKEIEIVKNDVKSLKEGIDQKITIINNNIERILMRMDKQDERWTEFYEKQSNRR